MEIDLIKLMVEARGEAEARLDKYSTDKEREAYVEGFEDCLDIVEKVSAIIFKGKG